MKPSPRKKIAIIVGTRPEAIKLAPVIQALKEQSTAFDVVVISTGQHKEMLAQVLSLFEIVPDIDLALMKPGQSLEYIAAEALRQLPEVFDAQGIDLVLVHGDTSTAFTAALAAFYRQLPVAHVEAGLRSYNKFHPFPEEINRRLISQVADFNFAPTQTSKEALLKEAVAEKTVFITGNTVIDALFYTVEKKFEFSDPLLQQLTSDNKRIVLLTAHRRENFGAPLEQICDAALELVAAHDDIEVVYPVHLNPQVQKVVRQKLENQKRIHLTDPLDYQSFVQMAKRSYLILTDSGGVQEEAPSLGKPVLVLRETTERPEAVKAGTVLLIGTDKNEIVQAASQLLGDKKKYQTMAQALNPYGDGKAAERICSILLHAFGHSKALPEEFSCSSV